MSVKFPESVDSKLERLRQFESVPEDDDMEDQSFNGKYTGNRSVTSSKTTTMKERFGKYLFDQTNSNVSIIVDNESIPANKTILCMRSDYFDDILSSTNQIVVTDFTQDIVRAFVTYLYTDEFEKNLTVDQGFQVLLMAKQYGVSDLVEVCQFYLSSKIEDIKDLNELIQILISSDKHSFNIIKAATLDCIVMMKSLAKSEPKYDSNVSNNSGSEFYDSGCDGQDNDSADIADSQTNKRQKTSENNETEIVVDPVLPENRALFEAVGVNLYIEICHRAMCHCKRLQRVMS